MKSQQIVIPTRTKQDAIKCLAVTLYVEHIDLRQQEEAGERPTTCFGFFAKLIDAPLEIEKSAVKKLLNLARENNSDPLTSSEHNALNNFRLGSRLKRFLKNNPTDVKLLTGQSEIITKVNLFILALEERCSLEQKSIIE